LRSSRTGRGVTKDERARARPALADALGSDEPELRVGLVGSQMIGLMMARYIVQVEPLASVPASRVVQAIAPTLQHYLTDPLPAGGLSPRRGRDAGRFDAQFLSASDRNSTMHHARVCRTFRCSHDNA
jgi:hypothetical protein